MAKLTSRLAPLLAQQRAGDRYRQRRSLDSPQAASIVLDGRECINFSSNDYLGLANDPAVVEAFCSAARQYGAGSGASHLVVGHHHIHDELEVALAEHTGRDRALLFSSGYMANLGVLNTLLKKGDVLFEDKLNHASLIDGGQSSAARLLRYRHNDLSHLELLLDKHYPSQGSSQGALLAVDGVFSMDGDTPPLEKLSRLCVARDVSLMVDDAHGFGVLGERGAGCSEYFSLTQNELPILMATLGKAVGVSGAFVAGSDELIEALIQWSRTYIYTTALPPACAAAALVSLRLIQSQPQRRVHLQSLIARFRSGAEQIGLSLAKSNTAIQPLIIGGSQRAIYLSQNLFEQGFYVAAIRPPTVLDGSARLRITLTAAHSEQQVDQLLSALQQSLSLLEVDDAS